MDLQKLSSKEKLQNASLSSRNRLTKTGGRRRRRLVGHQTEDGDDPRIDGCLVSGRGYRILHRFSRIIRSPRTKRNQQFNANSTRMARRSSCRVNRLHPRFHNSNRSIRQSSRNSIRNETQKIKNNYKLFRRLISTRRHARRNVRNDF